MSPTAFSDKPILAYQSAERIQKPSPVLATLLCLPGIACWAVLFSGIIGIFPFHLGIALTLFLWLVAILTAAFSIWFYFKSSKPWYVLLCLVSNVIGLAFTAVFLLVLLLLTAS
jgi:hypothetical protein